MFDYLERFSTPTFYILIMSFPMSFPNSALWCTVVYELFGIGLVCTPDTYQLFNHDMFNAWLHDPCDMWYMTT